MLIVFCCQATPSRPPNLYSQWRVYQARLGIEGTDRDGDKLFTSLDLVMKLLCFMVCACVHSQLMIMHTQVVLPVSYLQCFRI